MGAVFKNINFIKSSIFKLLKNLLYLSNVCILFPKNILFSNLPPLLSHAHTLGCSVAFRVTRVV